MKVNRLFLYMLAFIPLSWYFAFITHDKTWTFITAILAVIPLARIIGYATEEIVLQSNPTFAGLINATFGNIIELIISIIALSQGLIALVKASIIGSIIGNILLLIGLGVFFGGLKYKEQRFNQTSAGFSATMLIIAVAGLAIPTVYSLTSKTQAHIEVLSIVVAVVCALIYLAGLVFSFITHKDLFDASDEIKATRLRPTIGRKAASVILLITTLFVAFESELLVSGVQSAAREIGLTQTFIGVVVIAIITNIAEKANAIRFARLNKIDVSLEIGLSSAIQIALFVAPILVLVSYVFNYGFSLVFTTFEIIAVVLSVMIVNYLSADGKCNWLEGAQLIAVYLVIIAAFFFI